MFILFYKKKFKCYRLTAKKPRCSSGGLMDHSNDTYERFTLYMIVSSNVPDIPHTLESAKTLILIG